MRSKDFFTSVGYTGEWMGEEISLLDWVAMTESNPSLVSSSLASLSFSDQISYCFKIGESYHACVLNSGHGWGM